MSFSREQLSRALDKKIPPPFTPYEKIYMHREVPDQLFLIQEWCIQQGYRPGYPALTDIMQGIEYLLQYANGTYRDSMTQESIVEGVKNALIYYTDRRNRFKDGALRQYPELWKMLESALYQLPHGREVIEIIVNVPGYEHLHP